MRRLALLVLCGAALACGGDDDASSQEDRLDADYSATFTGEWLGTLSMTASGQTSSTDSVYMPITATGYNRLLLHGVCTETLGANATVTSASAFKVAAVTCPAIAVTGCSAVVLKYTGGTGARAGDTLTVNFSGEMSGCNKRFPLTARYVASALGAALRVAGPGFAEAAAAAF